MVGSHRRLTRRAVEGLEPALSTRDLLGGASYWDASTDDVRLTLANAIAAREKGAAGLNHSGVVELPPRDGGGCGAMIEDGPTGGAVGGSARLVVDAAGPCSGIVEAL